MNEWLKILCNDAEYEEEGKGEKNMTVQIVYKNGNTHTMYNVIDVKSEHYKRGVKIMFYIFNSFHFTYSKQIIWLSDIASMVIRGDEDADSD